MSKLPEQPLNISIPDQYWSLLNVGQTLQAVEFIQHQLSHFVAEQLHLQWVQPPMFVFPSTGLLPQDIALPEESCAVTDYTKWNRCALEKYKIAMDQGIYHISRESRAPSDERQNCSKTYLYWERRILPQQCFLSKLEQEVHLIVRAIADVQRQLVARYLSLGSLMNQSVVCLTAQYLENLYLSASLEERLQMICEKSGTVFLEQHGLMLDSGLMYSACPADVDNWNLNGVLLMQHPILQRPIEIAKLGIRADAAQFSAQWKISHSSAPPQHTFHQLLRRGRIPLSMGARVDLGAVAMLLLKKACIGEVEAGVWPNQFIIECEQRGIHLL